MSGVQFGEWPYLQEKSFVNSCAYSPDGKACAMGLSNGKISVYRTSDWGKIHTLEGHEGSVYSVVYSPHGDQLASGSNDKAVRVWEVNSGACLLVIEGFSAGVNSLAWKCSENAAYLLSGSGDKLVREWKLKKDGGEHKAMLCWSSVHGELTVMDTLLEGVVVLSEVNQRLLKQRGAALA